MSNFRRFFNKRRDTKDATGSPSVPLEHTVIERSEEDVVAYERWKKSAVKVRMLKWINQQYARYAIDHLETDEMIDFLKTPSLQGFAIYFDKTGYSTYEARFLLDYFKERVLSLNYKNALSDRRIFKKEHRQIAIEKHYLKPRVQLENDKLDQLFGNIMVELTLQDDVAQLLTFRATHYNDALYLPSRDFSILMRTLMQ